MAVNRTIHAIFMPDIYSWGAWVRPIPLFNTFPAAVMIAPYASLLLMEEASSSAPRTIVRELILTVWMRPSQISL